MKEPRLVAWRSLRAGNDGRPVSGYQWNECKYNHYAEGRFTYCGKRVGENAEYKQLPVCQRCWKMYCKIKHRMEKLRA